VDNASATSVLAEIEEGGVGRVEVTPLSSSVEAIHWSKLSEHFPVPTNKIINLPQVKPKGIPKIQFAFKKESATAKTEREAKLDIIKGVFKKSWNGYKEHAWLQDELSPVSGNFRNPFASWGATLVDALDTLWIMGMKTDFEEAVKAIDKIDFTTTPRADIPIFETTIRYLGGFLAAYDLSDRKYDSLLKKAVELAEVLISAFDTPNRMPQMYYYWRPAFASQPHRASNRVVLAEIGSLSVEFTRLAQLTGEHKYYDAIARITDALDEFQNKTRLAGMWPTYLDASGCKHIDYSVIDNAAQKPLPSVDNEEPAEQPTTPTKTEGKAPPEEEKLSPDGKKYKPLDLPPPIEFKAEQPTISPEENLEQALKIADKVQGIGESLKRRQLDVEAPLAEVATSTETAPAVPTPTRPECEEQGFVSSSDYGNEEYTLGGMSDSTYEYLPKQWLLLGGVIEKYRKMYEKSMDVVKDNLLFRPMLPNKDDILFSGKLLVPKEKPAVGNGELEGENAHLTCFAGGMFGMGAKIFDRPEDLKIAEKLTEGCVWSYNMTATGIMPESFITVPCESLSGCEWNETKYWEAIDPGADGRMETWKQQMDTYDSQMAAASSWYSEQMAAFTDPPKVPATGAVGVEAEATPLPKPRVDTELESSLEKRQLDVAESETKPKVNTVPAQNIADDSKPILANSEKNLMIESEPEEADDPPSPGTPVQPEASTEPSLTLPTFPAVYSPKPPLSHKEYVQNRIQEERLPPGVTNIRARNYILR
jgi:mannosyl-oligosaccharide alpha-1,2-mannosidase